MDVPERDPNPAHSPYEQPEAWEIPVTVRVSATFSIAVPFSRWSDEDDQQFESAFRPIYDSVDGKLLLGHGDIESLDELEVIEIIEED